MIFLVIVMLVVFLLMSMSLGWGIGVHQERIGITKDIDAEHFNVVKNVLYFLSVIGVGMMIIFVLIRFFKEVK
jgi:hypothetical protein